MARKKQVFVSYHYDNDKQYKNLMLAWDTNAKIDFQIQDKSPTEAINSKKAAVIKAVLTRKINEGSCLIVLIGKDTKKCDWVKWEIEKAKELNKKIIAVKLHPKNVSPSVLYRCGTIWVHAFRFEGIKLALLKV